LKIADVTPHPTLLGEHKVSASEGNGSIPAVNIKYTLVSSFDERDGLHVIHIPDIFISVMYPEAELVMKRMSYRIRFLFNGKLI